MIVSAASSKNTWFRNGLLGFELRRRISTLGTCLSKRFRNAPHLVVGYFESRPER